MHLFQQKNLVHECGTQSGGLAYVMPKTSQRRVEVAAARGVAAAAVRYEQAALETVQLSRGTAAALAKAAVELDCGTLQYFSLCSCLPLALGATCEHEQVAQALADGSDTLAVIGSRGGRPPTLSFSVRGLSMTAAQRQTKNSQQRGSGSVAAVMDFK